MLSEKFKDCYCRCQQNHLVIGNDLIEREYDLTGGIPRAVALRDRTLGRQWVPNGTARELFSLPGVPEGGFQSLRVCTGTDDHLGLSEQFLWVALDMDFGNCEVRTHLRIHPGVPAVSTYHLVSGAPQEVDRRESPPWDFQAAREEAHAMKEGTRPQPDTVESLPLPDTHLRARAVCTYDVTDYFNTLVREQEVLLFQGQGYEKLQGNLLFLSEDVPPRDAPRRAGLFVVKEAPNPVGQLCYPGYDLQTVARRVLEVRGTGLDPREFTPAQPLRSYGCTIGVFNPARDNGEEALRAWYNAEDRRRPERDVYVLANTWGNRSMDKKLSTEFLCAEVDRAAELGVDVCQIDFGWQRGDKLHDPAVDLDAGDLHYRGYRQDFWEIHEERFRPGFEAIRKHAARRGVALGVWFAPDDWNDFADWEADRDRLLALYRDCGMRHFKIDIYDVYSKLGESRLIRMLEGVMEGSGGEVSLQMDLTNCRRPGYFHYPHIGEVFLENRYTDWGNYYPHQTLRSAWQLARYVPTRRLQIEFLDLYRNEQKYAPHDPLRPQAWPMNYAFGVAVVGSPLAWMELSELSAEQVAALKPALETYRRERVRLNACDVWPIGEEPNGTSWTGFQAVHPEGGGYLVLFRELTDRRTGRFRLRGLQACQLELETCYGDGFESDGRVDDGGLLQVSLPEARSWALVRYGQ